MVAGWKSVLQFLGVLSLLWCATGLQITCMKSEHSEQCYSQYGHEARCINLSAFKGNTVVLSVKGDLRGTMRATDAVVVNEKSVSSSCLETAGVLEHSEILKDDIGSYYVSCSISTISRSQLEGQYSGLGAAHVNSCPLNCVKKLPCRRRASTQ
eukprot:TRINITY_DN56946_c0_g1_i1.p1 TRINITY_DN56946_c0_g1~~TRINITY_DN56946_c0_g1_i1.p1  ORF type:complete len:154 (+),score=10.23 TRINITY_DN56946_c0_g1_i1:65-526(+)